MTRREALSRAALLTGGVLSASTIAAIMGGCKADPSAKAASTFLTSEQEKMVSEICDLILPKTATPSATEVGVPAFIYAIMQDCEPQAEREGFALGLKKMDEAAGSFSKLTFDKKVAFLKDLDKAARENFDEKNPVHSAWRSLKQLTLVGFFTSEIGATEALEYLPIPGKLETCTEMQNNQRAWAT